jgi:para-aminobenzoate synthetase component 1
VLDEDTDDPFGKLEMFLGESGFAVTPGARADAGAMVADLYLGYRLAVTLPGVTAPQPPEPCPLPELACHVHPRLPAAEAKEAAVGDFVPTWSPSGYRAAIDAARAAIGRGDVYQVNLVQHLRAPFAGDPRAVLPRLAPVAGAWAMDMHGDGWSVVSASPELFLRTQGRWVETMPIKGTRPAASGGAIADSPKDRAEHIMIVDLERNDLGRVCEPGSIHVPSLMKESPMTGVRHLISTVAGTLRSDVGLADLLRATFPGGSVTGAPKVSAINHIARLEPVGRGASMAALGTVSPNGDIDLGLTIRTFAIAAGEIHLWVGGGIVWDSDPADEVEESLVKARPLLALL